MKHFDQTETGNSLTTVLNHQLSQLAKWRMQSFDPRKCKSIETPEREEHEM